MLKNFLKKNWLWLVPAIVLAAALGWWYFSPEKSERQVVKVRRGEVIQEVTFTGQVKAAQEVKLGFETSGRVAWVGVKAGERILWGQTLLALSNAELRAKLLEAEAALKAEAAELARLKRGTRPEEIQVQEAKVRDARENLLDKLREAFTKSDDAVRNQADQLFSSPRSAKPELNFLTEPQLETDLEFKRARMESILNSWSSAVGILSAASDLDMAASTAKENLAEVREFLDKVSLAVNALKSSAALSQSVLDDYRTDISTARTNVNTAANNLSAAEADWIIALREFDLKKAGTSAEEISIQEAQVEKAGAAVETARAQLQKTIIFSPFAGLVAKQEAKLGEIVAANEAVIWLSSDAEFQIEVAAPEADVAKIKVGHLAKITLDAYGNDAAFEAKIISIDPGETVIEGVATYKTILEFLTGDERIRPGLTANAEVRTAERKNVLFLPQRSVITKNGEKFVRVIQNGDSKERKVELGLRGSDGNIEIISGLAEGEEVLLGE